MIWGLALTGIVIKIFFVGRFNFVSTLTYLLMGWLVVIAVKPLIENLPLGGLLYLLAGGMFYSLGVIFYAWKSLPYHHAVWHMFVLGGSICHFFAILLYVLPA